jgi:hypothetical protein
MGGGAYFDSSVSVFGKLGNEEFVEFSVEASVSDELALGGHFGSLGHHLETIGVGKDGDGNGNGKGEKDWKDLTEDNLLD